MSRDVSGFGRLLREHRDGRGFTREDLAGRAGVDPNTIADLETGYHRGAYPSTVEKLTAALGLTGAEAAAFARAAAQARRRSPAAPPGVRPPPPPRPLFGREDAVAAGMTALRGTARLLTLTGPPGVGKTAVALGIADVLARTATFRGGIRFLALADLDDPSGAPAQIRRALGPAPASATTATRAGGSPDRAVLLLLDGVEGARGPIGALVAELLRARADLEVLATGQAPLHIRGERVHRIGPLAVPAGSPLPDPVAVARAPAVQLFVDRARAVVSDFDLTAENAGVIADICAAMEGLPLALELSAARVRHDPPRDLRTLLNAPLRVAREGPADAPPRQRSMEAALARAYSLLDPDAQALFRLFGALHDGGTFAALRALWGGTVGGDHGDLRLALQQLRDHSLVACHPGTGQATARYTTGPLARAYAGQRLAASGDAHTIRERHAAYYLRPGLQTAAAERGNIQAAEAWRNDHRRRGR